MISRILKITIALVAVVPSLFGQVVMRSEVAPYILRKDAMSGERSVSDNYIEFTPTAVSTSFGEITREQILEMPQSWVDAVVYLHLESVGQGYTLSVNGVQVAQCEDSATPTDYNISSYLRVGSNNISLVARHSELEQLAQGVEESRRKPLDGSYIYTQSRLRIMDYCATISPINDGKDARLFLDVIVTNSFNYPEQIEVGFDVYDPAGKLLDFSTTKATVAAGAIDTIRFAPYLYDAEKYRWSPDATTGMQVIGRPTTRFADQPLYSVMLYTKRTGVASGYTPFSVGYFVPEYNGTTLEVAGKSINLKAIDYNALGGEEQCEKELQEIKSKGYNTVMPSTPQPIWYYQMCDKVGLYVIDQAAINAPAGADDRTLGGSPSNDPKLAGEYLERVQKMYYRTRNFSCVVAYSLGSASGNGYNMYKAYQWLKGVESQRPIIYVGADGEWNSDYLTIN
ncbi:MAG: glycoside hydrolase family 2 TIM barrel-domain containing protein [Rikenellaceae bacterium]